MIKAMENTKKSIVFLLFIGLLLTTLVIIGNNQTKKYSVWFLGSSNEYNYHIVEAKSAPKKPKDGCVDFVNVSKVHVKQCGVSNFKIARLK
jgi:hypothetical protein